MLIGIDGNETNIKERIGVNVWAFELLKHLEGLRAKGQGIKADTKFVIYLSRPPLEDLPEESENWRYRVIGPVRFWTRWRLPIDLYFHKPRPDVFLSLSHYAPKWSPVPRIVCIMDLSFLKYPEAFKPEVLWQLKNWTRESVREANRVITISEFNKREIIKEYRYPEERITVIYPGVSDIYKIFKDRTLGTQGPTLRDKKYLLFVGTLQPKKNLPRLIEAFEIVRRKFPDVELVVAGKIWGQFSESKTAGYLKAWPRSGGARPYQMPEGIKFLGYVPVNDLPVLYAGAEALVLPSLYEGFGIPAAEAMSVGTLVLASNVASLPEVVGDAGILFDPLDVEDMADKIGMALSMSQIERQRLIKQGMIRSGRFDWKMSAESIISIIRSLLAVRQGDSLMD